MLQFRWFKFHSCHFLFARLRPWDCRLWVDLTKFQLILKKWIVEKNINSSFAIYTDIHNKSYFKSGLCIFFFQFLLDAMQLVNYAVGSFDDKCFSFFFFFFLLKMAQMCIFVSVKAIFSKSFSVVNECCRALYQPWSMVSLHCWHPPFNQHRFSLSNKLSTAL